ncbi:MAG TPA: tripartite tricarboxylate transporter substrate binding protein [Alphaproteobacteria bacterium]|nr:tripartite tricarboxylate transporter substrate binding protein [Alphaproteobacteria bacterium]
MRKTLVAAVLIAIAAAAPARANDAYPTRTVRIIMPFAAGGIIDVKGRLIADKLSAKFGQSVIVENRPGANTILGTQALIQSAPDGYTIMMTTSGTEIQNPLLYPNLPYDPLKQLQPITVTDTATNFLAVRKDSPIHDFKSLIETAQAHPQGLTFGSWGKGSSGHLFGELIKLKTGANLIHVPYRGELAALNDVVGGTLDMCWTSANGPKPMLDQGLVKLIGATGSARVASLPDVPTFAEQGWPDAQLGLYGIVYAPMGTPRPVVDALHDAFVAVVKSPDMEAKFADMGLRPIGNTPEEARALFRREYLVWKEVVEGAHIQID